MWLLVTVLCIQTSSIEAECHRYVRGPYQEAMDCRSLMKPVREWTQARADDAKMNVLFLVTSCRKGTDG